MRKIGKLWVTVIYLVLICGIVAGCTTVAPDTTNLASQLGTQNATQPSVPEDATPGETLPPSPETATLYLLTEITKFNAQGEELFKVSYTYDERGLLLSAQGERDGEDYAYTYNAYGHMTSETITLRDSGEQRVSLYTYTYDERGVLLTYTGMINNGYALPFYQFQYDAQGRLEKVIGEDNGTVYDAYICTYDKEGRLTEVQYKGRNEADVHWRFREVPDSCFLEITQEVFLGGESQVLSSESWRGTPGDEVSMINGRKKVRMTYTEGILTEMRYSMGEEEKVYTADEKGNVVRILQGDYYFVCSYQELTVDPEWVAAWRPCLNEYAFGMDITRFLDNILQYILPHNNDLMKP